MVGILSACENIKAVNSLALKSYTQRLSAMLKIMEKHLNAELSEIPWYK